MEILDIVNQLAQARTDGEAALVRHVAEEHIEIGDMVLHLRLEIAVPHGQLIEVTEHGQILFRHVYTPRFGLLF